MDSLNQTAISHQLRRRENMDLSSYTFGKIPPQAKDMEEAVLGALMLEANAMNSVLPILRNPDVFYINSHKIIYSAIMNLFVKNQPVDILTVTQELRTLGKLEDVGGAYYITQLTERIASAANVAFHALIVKQKWVQRERIRLASDIMRDAYEDTSDAEDGVGDDIDKFGNLQNEIAAGSGKTFKDRVAKTFTNIATASEKKVIGLTTGNKDLDRLVRYKPGQFIIVSGRPGHGKSSLAFECLLENAKEFYYAGTDEHVGISSLEMTDEEIILVLVAMESGVDVGLIERFELTPEQERMVSDARDLISQLPILIYDRGDQDGVSMKDLNGIAKAWKAKYNLKLLVIDYLQLMVGTGDKFTNRDKELTAISQGCKRLAKRLLIPILGISALSRKLEDRTGWAKRPNDADLRESGSFEYDANIIIHIFRPEKMQPSLESYNSDGYFNDNGSTTDTVELHVSKHRGSGGKLGRIRQTVNNGISRLSTYVSQGIVYHGPVKKSNVKINPYEAEKQDDAVPF